MDAECTVPGKSVMCHLFCHIHMFAIKTDAKMLQSYILFLFISQVEIQTIYEVLQ